MARARAYKILCVATGGLLLLAGVGLTVGFYRYHLGSPGPSAMPMGPNGSYFAGFAGTALVGWGGCLLASLRRDGALRTLGTATAVALVLAALQRMGAWLVGDYALLGNLPRMEAAFMLGLALAFVWLRPPTARQAV